MDEIITIAKYPNAAEAHLARSVLEDAGIEAIVADENIVGLQELCFGEFGGVRLQARQSDAAQALEVLNATRDAAAPGETAQCPRCHSLDVKPNPGKKRLSRLRHAMAISFSGFPIPFPLGHQYWTCRRCGEKWESGPNVQTKP